MAVYVQAVFLYRPEFAASLSAQSVKHEAHATPNRKNVSG